MKSFLFHGLAAIATTLLFAGFWIGWTDVHLQWKIFTAAWASTTLYSIVYSICGGISRWWNKTSG